MSDQNTYSFDHTSKEDEVLRELRFATQEKFFNHAMSTGHVEATLLKMLVEISGAKRILEFGTFTGYSALAMAMGLPDDGELYTFDINKESTDFAKEFWAKSPHGQKIKLILGEALESVKELAGEFDLAFIDADKMNYENYYEVGLEKVRSGGLIIIDNTWWKGAVLDPKEKRDILIDSLNKKIAADGRVEAVFLTVRDGITLVRKK